MFNGDTQNNFEGLHGLQTAHDADEWRSDARGRAVDLHGLVDRIKAGVAGATFDRWIPNHELTLEPNRGGRDERRSA